MIRRHIQKDSWDYVSQANSKKHRRDYYKLHISISIDYFDKLRIKIEEILNDAIATDTISKYKIWRFANNADKTDWRFNQIPYTLYLNDNLTPKKFAKIGSLCQQIEDTLKNIPPGDDRYLAICDLSLTPHITFRQARFRHSKKYVTAFSDLATQQQLQKEGEKSICYNTLSWLLHPDNSLFKQAQSDQNHFCFFSKRPGHSTAEEKSSQKTNDFSPSYTV